MCTQGLEFQLCLDPKLAQKVKITVCSSMGGGIFSLAYCADSLVQVLHCCGGPNFLKKFCLFCTEQFEKAKSSKFRAQRNVDRQIIMREILHHGSTSHRLLIH